MQIINPNVAAPVTLPNDTTAVDALNAGFTGGVNKLNAESNRALGAADVRQRLDQLGLEVGGGTPEEFAQFIDSEAGKLRMLIKSGALTPE